MFNASKVQRLFFSNFAAFSGFCLGLLVSGKMLSLFDIKEAKEAGDDAN